MLTSSFKWPGKLSRVFSTTKKKNFSKNDLQKYELIFVECSLSEFEKLRACVSFLQRYVDEVKALPPNGVDSQKHAGLFRVGTGKLDRAKLNIGLEDVKTFQETTVFLQKMFKKAKNKVKFIHLLGAVVKERLLSMTKRLLPFEKAIEDVNEHADMAVLFAKSLMENLHFGPHSKLAAFSLVIELLSLTNDIGNMPAFRYDQPLEALKMVAIPLCVDTSASTSANQVMSLFSGDRTNSFLLNLFRKSNAIKEDLEEDKESFLEMFNPNWWNSRKKTEMFGALQWEKDSDEESIDDEVEISEFLKHTSRAIWPSVLDSKRYSLSEFMPKENNNQY